MRLKRIKWGLVLFWGWLVILISAAVILPRAESKAIAFPILVLMLMWFLLSVVALVFYFYRAWRRVGAVPNKAAYIAWMSIETVFALAALAWLVWFFVTPS
ncbi:MAG: hypothetical protein WCC22_12065 [Terriglobales bacterium]